jgi:hypothetical protein
VSPKRSSPHATYACKAFERLLETLRRVRLAAIMDQNLNRRITLDVHTFYRVVFAKYSESQTRVQGEG